jgi:hypothetical protein
MLSLQGLQALRIALMSRCVRVRVRALWVHTVVHRLVSLDKTSCFTDAPPAHTDPRRL